MNTHPLFINTCVFGAVKFPLIREYSKIWGSRIGFEILSMFDLPDFEDRLRENLDVLEKHRITFHEPVFFVEHSAPRGSAVYEQSMWHIRKTYEYAKRLHSAHMTMHLNNCRVIPEKKDQMLKTSLENFREIQEMFAPIGCPLYLENTGIRIQGNLLLDQQEFTDLCRDLHLEVLIDVGHAHANGWDLKKLISDLQPQIRAYHLHNNDGIHDQHFRLHEGTLDFPSLMQTILEKTPDAELTIEYTRPAQEGEGLREDIREVLSYIENNE